MRTSRWLAVLLGLGLACSESSGPAAVPGSELHFVQQDPLAPPLYTVRDSMWAKVGDGRELRLFYQGATPVERGEEFLRLEVPGDALYRWPDGSLFQPGDSVLITVTVVNPAEFVFQFEPSGLTFRTDHPARLKIEYHHGDHDFDRDGDEDATDAEIEQHLDLWHQAQVDGPWRSTSAVQFSELDELDTNILAFSQYAVAW